jgi:hypothetical protein
MSQMGKMRWPKRRFQKSNRLGQMSSGQSSLIGVARRVNSRDACSLFSQLTIRHLPLFPPRNTACHFEFTSTNTFSPSFHSIQDILIVNVLQFIYLDACLDCPFVCGMVGAGFGASAKGAGSSRRRAGSSRPTCLQVKFYLEDLSRFVFYFRD